MGTSEQEAQIRPGSRLPVSRLLPGSHVAYHGATHTQLALNRLRAAVAHRSSESNLTNNEAAILAHLLVPYLRRSDLDLAAIRAGTLLSMKQFGLLSSRSVVAYPQERLRFSRLISPRDSNRRADVLTLAAAGGMVP
ncbi:hypothetical protein OH76DRAFT_638897 [Lentinus brumalis]|uniref:Uncharacterized protein n=1 Tax=Lentinus brumalis TaxID=2498619 RepID=A0A371CHB0_9APHY|nr:hypothetical protein OH76DRAFT_638897 [Polyporus brumalis]